MVKIGLISDTHSYWDEKYIQYLCSCDEIWHAGDIGSEEIIDKLEKINPLRIVYGNIDNSQIQLRSNYELTFTIEDINVYMIHIGGYPGKYAKGIKDKILKNKIDLFVSGHSHILKVMYDKTLNCLHINSGAAGKYGFHKTRTIIRFCIDKKQIKDLEVIEINDNQD